MRRIPIAVVASALLAMAGPARTQEAPYRQARRVMGSLAEIQVYHPDPQVAVRAMTAALDEMDRVDRLLSNYQPETELSRMNRLAAKAPFQASPELFEFVKRCHAYFAESLGTFDPTMGPLVRAWGFFTPHPVRPSMSDAASARARAGFDKVRLDEASHAVSYAVEGLELDPGGIGKGYAADRAAAVLRQFGITSALVSAGGSTLYAVGHPPGRDGWKLAVRDPATPATSLRFVTLRDGAISTSGISDRFIEVDGHRYGHIFDPRSGEPAEGMCQVSVIAPSATDSDALTKPAFILPRESVQALFSKREAVHVIRIEGPCGHGVVWTTPWSSGVFGRN